MIGLLGYIELATGRSTPYESSGINQYMRTDDTAVTCGLESSGLFLTSRQRQLINGDSQFEIGAGNR